MQGIILFKIYINRVLPYLFLVYIVVFYAEKQYLCTDFRANEC